MLKSPRYIFRTLFPLGLIFIVAVSGFFLLFSSQQVLNETERKLDQRIENAVRGKELGQLIVSELGELSTKFYMILVSANVDRQTALMADVEASVQKISDISHLLVHGGSLRLSITTADSLKTYSYLVNYDPAAGPRLDTDLASLSDRMARLERQVSQILDLTVARNDALLSGNAEDLRQAGLRLRVFEGDVSRDLQWVRSQALHVVMAATDAYNQLTLQVGQARRAGHTKDLQTTATILAIICGFIAVIFLQVRASQQRLVKTIASLKVAQEDLHESHRRIVILNETLEEQVDVRTRALQVSEQQWSDAFNAISAPLFIHDHKGKIIKANQAYLALAEVSLEAAVGVTYWSLFPRRNMPIPGCLCTPHQGQGRDHVHETNLKVDDRIYRSQSFSVRDTEGEYLYGMHLMEDVTEQVSNRVKLQDSEQRFRDLTDSLDVSLILVDADLRIQMLNQAARECYQLTDRDYLGESCKEVFGALGIICDHASITEIFNDGKMITRQKRTSTGRIFKLKFHPVADADGRVFACTIVTIDISEREKYIGTLRRYQQIVATSRDLVAFFDRNYHYLAVNKEYASYFGLTEAEIIGRHAKDIIGEERYRDYLQYEEQFFRQKQPFAVTDWITYPARGRRFVELSVFPHFDNETIVGFVVRGRDITEKNQQEARLRLSGKVIESVDEGILITDSSGSILTVNPAFTRITGYAEDEVIGKNPSILKSGRHDEGFYRQMWKSLQDVGHWRGEIWNRRKQGEVYPELLTINTISSETGNTNYVAVFTDISSLKKTSEKLEHLAHHTPLTGLPNRRLLQARLEHSLQNARREGTRGAVIYIDLDNFKKINDSLGHSAGDEVLKTVAGRLMAGARQVDTVAHLSGDEFVTVLHKTKTIDDAVIRAEQIIACLQQPFLIGDYELMVSGSLGIAEYDGSTGDIDNLLKNADAAMYKAKESGKNRYHVYSPELTEKAVEKVLMESHLRKALERDELILYYQPQIDLHSGRIVAAEALLRWDHPELGLVSPDKFIPLSEDTGQIIPIGKWVLKTACRQMMMWRKQGLGLKRIAVNLSGKQIQLKDLHKQVEEILYETGLPSGSLELEITEGFVMQHPEQSIAVLQNIRNLGVELSIDDFGTGHSSLNYLKRLPINRLKIDRTFVNDIGTEMEGEAITRAVIAMGRSLNLQITAEGVETSEQHEYLQAHGCHEAQGYLFSRPLAAKNMLELLESDRILTKHS